MTDANRPLAPAMSAGAALDLLAGGNRRLLDAISSAPDPGAARLEFAKAKPFAVILGCADSRVPPEIVFDERPGRLFVVRAGAAVAGPDEIGSVEYAVARWDCPLVVVLGHTECGAIAASLDPLPPGVDPQPDPAGWAGLRPLVGSIRAAMGDTRACYAAPDPWRAAAELHVRRTVALLRESSEPMRRRVAGGRVEILGAMFDLRTARVEFLD